MHRLKDSILMLCVITILCSLQSLPAASAAEGWLADPKTACQAWIPDVDRATSISWSGKCQNGKANGGGILQWFDATGQKTGEFIGYCSDGKMHGNGVLTFHKGDRYTGQFTDGRIEGRGMLFFHRSGETFTGSFKNGSPSGRGVSFLDEGGIFIGEWGLNGDGVLILPDGEVLKGFFNQGRLTAPR